MGYESKLIIGEAGTWLDRRTGGTWVDVIAQYDLCKMGSGPFARLLSASKAERVDKRDFYFYGIDGDERVTEDLYGDRLLPLDLEHTIEALEQCDPEYRRLAPVIALLRAIRDSSDLWRDLVVLHWGH